jgi:murein L,D-transpeptidase YcbB/YkuD
MDGMLEIIEKIKTVNDAGDVNFKWVAKFDLLMTDAILLYAYHLLEGKVNPYDLDVQWNFGYTQLPGGNSEKLANAIKNKSVSQELHKLRPQLAGYSIMMDELVKYRAIADAGGWSTISDGGKIDPGDTDSRIPDIRKRLNLSGDLTDKSDLTNETYDAQLEKDIRYFQEKHGLDSDGIIGKGTFTALNVPVEEKIDQIRVNLERYRWIVHNLSEYFIIVNIARFKVYVVQNNEVIHKTNVQVGSYYHKTPVFKSRLKYIEFNPTWTVPRSITVNEMIPKIKKNHDYLQNKNMVLLDGSDNIVPLSSVDFEKISVKNFPYVIRQEPGPGNALGQMKFIFPNKYSVYLHDTPSKYLFDRASRSFSHGCIRTQNPLQLAEVLLEETDWNKQKIRETLDSKVTTRAYFDKPIDVLLLYWTAGVYQDESVFYFPDIYKRDQPILEKLDKEVEVVALKKLR